jgi:predicted molibdopterin-dependent oxidoreductase YjgC
VAIVASARQTTEELYLLQKLATRLEAMTDSVPRKGRRTAAGQRRSQSEQHGAG